MRIDYSFHGRSHWLFAALIVALPITAHADRNWILASSTQLEGGKDSVVTIDASSSDDLFHPGRGVALDNLVVSAPDGSKVAPDSTVIGKQRSSAEITLPMAGTYKIAIVNDRLTARYKVDGELKRWRGIGGATPPELPAEAQELRVTRVQLRQETFVTMGNSGTEVFKPTGVGLELVPVTHPNGMFAGETANFRFLLDGESAADIAVTVILGGNRYRDNLREVTIRTDQDGKFSVKFLTAGMYWLGAYAGDPRTMPGGSFEKPVRRASYSATMDVSNP